MKWKMVILIFTILHQTIRAPNFLIIYLFVMDPTAYLCSDDTGEPWKPPSKAALDRQLNKSLALLGFHTWLELEPGKITKLS